MCALIPAVDGVVRVRLKDLAHWIFEEFGILIDETTMGRAEGDRVPQAANSAPVTMPRMSKRLRRLKKFEAKLAEIEADLPSDSQLDRTRGMPCP